MSSAPSAPPAARQPFVHNWGIPEIRRPPLAPPSNGQYPGRNPLPLHGLRFNPLGAFDLRRHLGIFPHDPSIWNTYRQRFLAADIAWLATGASDDNQHEPGARGFFPEFRNLRDSLPSNDLGYTARADFSESIRRMIWDLAMMWDRTFGSTTIILHVNGTMIPGSPASPDYLRASAHNAIANIAQTFIESVGVPTVRAWAEDARLLGWRLTQGHGIVTPNHVDVNELIPTPQQNGSSHYVFRGRPQTGASSVTADSDSTTQLPPSPGSTRYGSEEPLSAETMALLSALERIAVLESEVEQLRGHLEATTNDHLSTIQQLATTEAELNAATAREVGYGDQQRELQAYVMSLQRQGSVRRASLRIARQRRPRALPKTQAFLEKHSLEEHLPAMRMATRLAPPTRWYLEIAALDLDDKVAGELLDCLEADCL
ncbi:hypothetical protein B0H16DRAFT_1894840 [Mycena metata]|uniref:Uncharacterized protein n=1 Tax=Mycena metata TaxID=1033252 RepID=A0AAD7HQT6_9AGAR|nr:hypothetical protein B0H16DRAFT_1894840 [Mycena metata]